VSGYYCGRDGACPLSTWGKQTSITPPASSSSSSASSLAFCARSFGASRSPSAPSADDSVCTFAAMAYSPCARGASGEAKGEWSNRVVKQSGQTEWSIRGPQEEGARARPRPASGLKT
jgi:hypothetical protein